MLLWWTMCILCARIEIIDAIQSLLIILMGKSYFFPTTVVDLHGLLVYGTVLFWECESWRIFVLYNVIHDLTFHFYGLENSDRLCAFLDRYVLVSRKIFEMNNRKFKLTQFPSSEIHIIATSWRITVHMTSPSNCTYSFR